MKITRNAVSKFPKQSPDHPPIQNSSPENKSKIIVRFRTSRDITKSDVKKSNAASSITPSENVVGPSTGPRQEEEKDKDIDKLVTSRSENKKNTMIKKQRFSISLTKEEIELDFLRLTGVKPKRKPRKRNKNVQTGLDNTFPGLKLHTITPRDYR